MKGLMPRLPNLFTDRLSHVAAAQLMILHSEGRAAFGTSCGLTSVFFGINREIIGADCTCTGAAAWIGRMCLQVCMKGTPAALAQSMVARMPAWYVCCVSSVSVRGLADVSPSWAASGRESPVHQVCLPPISPVRANLWGGRVLVCAGSFFFGRFAV